MNYKNKVRSLLPFVFCAGLGHAKLFAEEIAVKLKVLEVDYNKISSNFSAPIVVDVVGNLNLEKLKTAGETHLQHGQKTLFQEAIDHLVDVDQVYSKNWEPQLENGQPNELLISRLNEMGIKGSEYRALKINRRSMANLLRLDSLLGYELITHAEDPANFIPLQRGKAENTKWKIVILKRTLAVQPKLHYFLYFATAEVQNLNIDTPIIDGNRYEMEVGVATANQFISYNEAKFSVAPDVLNIESSLPDLNSGESMLDAYMPVVFKDFSDDEAVSVADNLILVRTHSDLGCTKQVTSLEEYTHEISDLDYITSIPMGCYRGVVNPAVLSSYDFYFKGILLDLTEDNNTFRISPTSDRLINLNFSFVKREY